MRILAIDTSGGAVGVAICESGAAQPLALRQRAMARGHAEALAPLVAEILGEIEGGVASLDRIAVAVGPGSFTGIRVGVAFARAMGVGLGVPVVGVSSLAAYAAPLLAEPRQGVIAACVDARHGAVYFQLFEATGRPLTPPRVEAPRDVVRVIGAGPAWFAGDATAILALEAQRANLPHDASNASPYPDVTWVARIGLASDPASAPPRPLYIKPPDAKPNPAEPIARAPA